MEEKRNQEIEDIAWQVFQRKLGISFKRELTPEEKLTISEKPEYEYYREIATRAYLKKQKALLNKKYSVIDIPASGKRGMMGGAYCLCFVYSKYKGNFVLRGYHREVEEYLKKNYTHYFCNYSLWNLGQNRDIWDFWKKKISISPPSRESKIFTGNDRWKFKVYEYVPWFRKSDDDVEEKEDITLWFKRMPKRWIPEFDKL